MDAPKTVLLGPFPGPPTQSPQLSRALTQRPDLVDVTPHQASRNLQAKHRDHTPGLLPMQIPLVMSTGKTAAGIQQRLGAGGGQQMSAPPK